jgi:hypothetical protein
MTQALYAHMNNKRKKKRKKIGQVLEVSAGQCKNNETPWYVVLFSYTRSKPDA